MAKITGRRLIVIVTSLIVIVGIAVAAYVFLVVLRNPADTSVSEETKKELATLDKASEAAKKHNKTETEQHYKELISSETGSDRKVMLYLDWARVLYMNGDTADAIKVAKEAEKIDDDKFLVADWLSITYEKEKNYAAAAEYFELAGKWAKSATNDYGLDKEYFDGEAARVRALETKQ